MKLQNRYADLERRYHMAIAASGDGDNDGSFVTRLLRIISEMYNKEQYRYFCNYYLILLLCNCALWMQVLTHD